MELLMMTLLVSAIFGGLGGVIRLLVSGKGLIALPQIIKGKQGNLYLNLGGLLPIIIGSIAGALSRQTLGIDSVVSAIVGYAGTDFLENIIERRLLQPYALKNGLILPPEKEKHENNLWYA